MAFDGRFGQRTGKNRYIHSLGVVLERNVGAFLVAGVDLYDPNMVEIVSHHEAGNELMSYRRASTLVVGSVVRRRKPCKRALPCVSKFCSMYIIYLAYLSSAMSIGVYSFQAKTALFVQPYGA